MQHLRLAQPRLRHLKGHRSSRRQRRRKLRLDQARPRRPSTLWRPASRWPATHRPGPAPPQSQRHRTRAPPLRSRSEGLGSQQLQSQHLQENRPSMNLPSWIRKPANWPTFSMETWLTIRPIPEQTVGSLCLDRGNGEPIQGPSAARGAIPSASRLSSRAPTRRFSSCSTPPAPCAVFAQTSLLGSTAIFSATHGITTNQCIR